VAVALPSAADVVPAELAEALKGIGKGAPRGIAAGNAAAISRAVQRRAMWRVPRAWLISCWKALSSNSASSKVTEKVLRLVAPSSTASAVVSEESRPPLR
jgi:hypothetical protein